ncbi:hypothetical protein GQ457_01G026310 [Hibiscus cannabinus]
MVAKGSTHQELVYTTRAYILQLIGGILVLDTYKNMVHTQYLWMLADLNTVVEYSWGSAVLTFLYHEMCRVTIINGEKRSSGMGGCQILLQSWAWYGLSYLMPIVDVPVPREFPLSEKKCFSVKYFEVQFAPLIHFGIVEYHCGDRVLRQFSYHQPIPRPPTSKHICIQFIDADSMRIEL